MKIVEKMIRIGLAVLVLLSLYLSMNIWLSSSKKETAEKTDTKVAAPVNERTSKDVFQPLRLIRLQDGKTEMNNNENLISTIQLEIKKASYEKLTKIVSQNSGQFETNQSIEQGFELMYEGAFLLSEYVNIYDLRLDLSDVNGGENVYFTKIQVDSIKHKIRFLDYQQKSIYEASIAIDQEAVASLLDKEGVQFHKVDKQQNAVEQQYYLTDDLQMKKYSYILESQPITRFRNAFFNNPDDIRTNENSQDLSYTSGQERLTVFDDSQSTIVKFEGQIADVENQNIYSETFPYVKKLGTNMGNIRYFDRTETQINYRTFVEGFPVFSDGNKGQLQMTLTDEISGQTTIQIETSVDTIQIPIPSDEEILLDSTDKVLDLLIRSGAKAERINSLVIGYTWQSIDETKSVVDLTPEWYVKYNEKWYTENELLNALANLEVE